MDLTTNRRNLAAGFQQRFVLVPAFDEPARVEVFRVRHAVYCEDLRWEPPREDGLEQDAFDAQALHCLLRQRDSGETVGCIRLVRTLQQDPTTPLPFELACHDAIDRQIVDPAALPREAIGEVSRLAVMRGYRRRRGEAETAVPVGSQPFGSDDSQRQRFPFIPVALFLAAASMAVRQGVEHVFVLTEPRLAAHFTRIGFDIQGVGRPIEHRGTRIPSMMNSFRVVAGLRPIVRPLFEVVDEAVAHGLRAASLPPGSVRMP